MDTFYTKILKQNLFFVKDRFKKSWHSIDKIMDDGIGEIIEELKTASAS